MLLLSLLQVLPTAGAAPPPITIVVDEAGAPERLHVEIDLDGDGNPEFRARGNEHVTEGCEATYAGNPDALRGWTQLDLRRPEQGLATPPVVTLLALDSGNLTVRIDADQDGSAESETTTRFWAAPHTLERYMDPPADLSWETHEWFASGLSAAASGDFAAATAAFEQVITAAPEICAARFNLAQAAVDAGDTDGALAGYAGYHTCTGAEAAPAVKALVRALQARIK